MIDARYIKSIFKFELTLLPVNLSTFFASFVWEKPSNP